jgi:hypothetical protein
MKTLERAFSACKLNIVDTQNYLLFREIIFYKNVDSVPTKSAYALYNERSAYKARGYLLTK